MLSLSSTVLKCVGAVFRRGMMFAFIYLALEFTRMFIDASANTHPYMAMWSTVLFDLTVIIIFNLEFGNNSCVRDIGTLNLYAVIFHLIYIPCFFYGYQFGDYHNYAIKCVNGLIALRLFYFGERELLSRISIITPPKKWLLGRNWFINSYVNGLTVTIFALCAAPLFTLIYLINTDKMRITGIAIILFSFYVAIEHSKKRILIGATPKPEIVPPAKEDNAAPIAAPHDDANELARAKTRIESLVEACKILIGGFIVCSFLGGYAAHFKSKKMFVFGYAFGYADGKSGTKPKSETRFTRLVDCYDRPDIGGRPAPPDPTCKDVFDTEPPKNEAPKNEAPKK